jgi:PIN domain nuclease of toxin-antitoxin system
VICLDTHAWHWWVSDDRRLPAVLRRRIEREPAAISVVSIWELAQLVQEGRISLGVEVRQYLQAATAWEGLTVVTITPELAVRASRLGPLFPSDPMDRLITATAIGLGAPLVTSDAAITRSGVVPILWD